MNFDLMRSLLIDRALRGELFSNVTSVEAEGKSLEEEQTTPFTIPNHWQWKRVADCVQFNPKVIQDDAVEVSFIPMADVEPGFVDHCSTRQAKPWAKVKKGFSRFQEGDLLVAKITPCFQNRKSCVAKSLINGTGAGSTEFHVMRCVSGVDAKFLLYFFKSEYFIRYGVNHFNGTVGQQRVGAQDIKDCLIPVPSVEEQVRIVAKLEDAFAEIDRAEKAYEELQTLAGVLRGQILQEAIQGKLVPQLAEEGVVEQFGAAPKEVPFTIPESWKWCYMKGITKKIHYGFTASAANAGNAKLLRITDIQDGRVNWDTVPFCDVPEKKLASCKLGESDVVIARTGGTIGKSFLLTDVSDVAVFASYLIRLIPCAEVVNPRYLMVFLNSQEYWKQLKAMSQGTGQPNVNAKSLSTLLLPLPPLDEQARIVAKVEELLKHVDALSAK